MERNMHSHSLCLFTFQFRQHLARGGIYNAESATVRSSPGQFKASAIGSSLALRSVTASGCLLLPEKAATVSFNLTKERKNSEVNAICWEIFSLYCLGSVSFKKYFDCLYSVGLRRGRHCDGTVSQMMLQTRQAPFPPFLMLSAPSSVPFLQK